MTLGKPGNLVVVPHPTSGEDTLRLTWDDCSTSEDRYHVFRADDPNGTFSQVAGLPANTTTHDDTGLTPSTQYCYKVRSWSSAAGFGPFSDVVCGRTDDDTNAPNPPTNLQADAVKRGEMRLTFTDNADNEDGFDIQFSQEDQFLPGSTTTVGAAASAGTGSVTYDVTGLSPVTFYYFRVRAHRTPVSTRLNSDWSNVDGERTLSGKGTGGPPGAAKVVPPPGGEPPNKGIGLNPPLNVTVTPGVRSNTVSWSDNSTDNDSHLVDFSRDSGRSWQRLARVPDQKSSINHGGLEITRYCYRVAAARGSPPYFSQSDWSPTVCGTPLKDGSGEKSRGRGNRRRFGGVIDGATPLTAIDVLASDSIIEFFSCASSSYPGNLVHLVAYDGPTNSDYRILSYDARRNKGTQGMFVPAGTDLRLFTPGGGGTDTFWTLAFREL